MWRRFYEKHRERMCAKSREQYRRHKAKHHAACRRRAQKQVEYIKHLKATTPCSDCKQQFPWFVMEFDHVRGTKKHCVTSLTGSLRLVEEEIAKCDIVCANCHRIRTYNRKTLYKSLHPKRAA